MGGHPGKGHGGKAISGLGYVSVRPTEMPTGGFADALQRAANTGGGGAMGGGFSGPGGSGPGGGSSGTSGGGTSSSVSSSGYQSGNSTPTPPPRPE